MAVTNAQIAEQLEALKVLVEHQLDADAVLGRLDAIEARLLDNAGNLHAELNQRIYNVDERVHSIESLVVGHIDRPRPLTFKQRWDALMESIMGANPRKR